MVRSTSAQFRNDRATVDAAVAPPRAAVDQTPATLPTGIVTFLLTDIQDSTRLWDACPREMRGATVQHDRIVEAAVARHAGLLVRPRGEGDSRFAVFRRATDAVAAAADIQLTLQGASWDLPEPIRVHLGIHSGEADLRDGDYYGGAVNRCARLRILARGGQILLSGATRDLVQDAPDGWPTGTAPRALGEYRLAGLSRPERIFELTVAGLAGDFPPLAIAVEPPNNLLAELTSFIGRARELAQLERQLLDVNVRLVTLIGPGGVGKTRLAERVAHNVLSAFTDGVFFVALAATVDAQLIASAIAQALGMYDGSNRPALEFLVDRLRDKQMLLVLDNLEQLPKAAPAIAAILQACPRVKVLATSRARLRVSGEHRVAIAPLSLPDTTEPEPEAARSESVRLFVDRARAADADFELTLGNAEAVQNICRTLDGLPLAIELVAARAADFSPAQLFTHLVQRRLALVSGGPDDAPERHQSLRAAIAWSQALLSSDEQATFRRLAVFAGGCTVAEAQRVCQLGDDELQAHTVLSALADKSLLRHDRFDDAAPRFRMLETIREFALEALDRSADAAATHARYAQVFADLLDSAAAHRNGPEEATWLQSLATELDNLRSAWRWAIDHAQEELALHMAEAALPFLTTYGYSQEGARWLAEVLRITTHLATPLRARVALGAGWLNHQLGNLPAAEQFFRDALAAGRASDDRRIMCAALGGLAFSLHEQGHFDQAQAAAEESLTLARLLADPSQLARAFTRQAEMLALNADAAGAEAAAEQAIAGAEAAGDTGCLAAALDTLGLAKRLEGDAEEAARLLERASKLHAEFRYKANEAEALLRWADALLLKGDHPAAAIRCREALRLARDASNQRRVATSLRVAASIASAQGDAAAALELADAARSHYAAHGYHLTRVEQADLDAVYAAAATRGIGSSPSRGLDSVALDKLIGALLETPNAS